MFVSSAVYETKYRPRVLVERISREDFGEGHKSKTSVPGGSGSSDKRVKSSPASVRSGEKDEEELEMEEEGEVGLVS